MRLGTGAGSVGRSRFFVDHFRLTDRTDANKVGVFYERSAVSRLVVELTEYSSAFPFYPTPIAELLKFEVGGIDEVDSVVFDESVGVDGNTVVTYGLESAVKVHVVDVGSGGL